MNDEEIWLNLNCHLKSVNAFALFLVYLSTNIFADIFIDIFADNRRVDHLCQEFMF